MDRGPHAGPINITDTFADAIPDIRPNKGAYPRPDPLTDTITDPGTIAEPHAVTNPDPDPVAHALAVPAPDQAPDQLADIRSLSHYYVLTGLRWCSVGRQWP